MAGPNIKDIAGLGEIVGHIKDFLLKIIETRSAREERRLRNESLRLKNTFKFLALAKKYNLTPEELKYYKGLANGGQDTNPEISRIEIVLIKAAENSSESQTFSTEYGEDQHLSKPHFDETKDSLC
jgi:hypothetical protein